MTERRESFAERVTRQLLEQLEQGTAPIQKPWDPHAPSALPMNPTTQKRYRGINVLHLMAQGRGDPRWLTYRQAQSAGAQVRKSEKGTAIQYWKFSETRALRDGEGKPERDDTGNTVSVEIKLSRPRVFTAVVFNAEQMDGLPELAPRIIGWDPCARAEELIQASRARIDHSARDRAFYSPLTDTIHLPAKAQFHSSSGYYAVALHELGHWTGDASRLARDLAHPFGSEGYAREELRNEIASLILGSELGVGHDHQAHASYVASWIAVLKRDPLELLRAAADAEKIGVFLMGLTRAQQLDSSEQIPVVANSAVEALPSQGASERVEVFEHDGLRCTVEEVRSILGETWFVGYVDLPPSHPMHGHDFVENGSLGVHVPKGFTNCERTEVGEWRVGFDSATDKQVACDEFIGFVREVATQFADRMRQQEQDSMRVDRDRSNEAPAARHWLAVPYVDREQAKACGARWDRGAKCWYAPPGVDLEKLARWEPSRLSDYAPPQNAREEFTRVLLELGCVVTGDHPIMDGRRHRIRTAGDRRREKAGFYIAYLDGVPSGYAMDWRTGQEIRWRAKGIACTPEELAQARANVLKLQQEREQEQDRMYAATAARLERGLRDLVPITTVTPYLERKGVTPAVGVFTDAEGQTTFVPAYDVHGKLWSIQSIQADGAKRFAWNSRHDGCFHPVGGWRALSSASVLILAEGYATAATLANVLGQPALSVFNAANLVPVAAALRERFPNKPMVIAADDDRALQAKRGKNPGQEYARVAADASGAFIATPVFAPGEETLTDFNDLATKSVLGECARAAGHCSDCSCDRRNPNSRACAHSEAEPLARTVHGIAPACRLVTRALLFERRSKQQLLDERRLVRRR